MPRITITDDDDVVIEIIEVPMDAIAHHALDLDAVQDDTMHAVERAIDAQAEKDQLASAQRHREEWDAKGGFTHSKKEQQ